MCSMFPCTQEHLGFPFQHSWIQSSSGVVCWPRAPHSHQHPKLLAYVLDQDATLPHTQNLSPIKVPQAQASNKPGQHAILGLSPPKGLKIWRNPQTPSCHNAQCLGESSQVPTCPNRLHPLGHQQVHNSRPHRLATLPARAQNDGGPSMSSYTGTESININYILSWFNDFLTLLKFIWKTLNIFSFGHPSQSFQFPCYALVFLFLFNSWLREVLSIWLKCKLEMCHLRNK